MGVTPSVMGVVAFIAYRLLHVMLGNAVSCLISICLGALVYVVVALAIKTISPDEIEGMPKGKKLAGIVRKFTR